MSEYCIGVIYYRSLREEGRLPGFILYIDKCSPGATIYYVVFCNSELETITKCPLERTKNSVIMMYLPTLIITWPFHSILLEHTHISIGD